MPLHAAAGAGRPVEAVDDPDAVCDGPRVGEVPRFVMERVGLPVCGKRVGRSFGEQGKRFGGVVSKSVWMALEGKAQPLARGDGGGFARGGVDGHALLRRTFRSALFAGPHAHDGRAEGLGRGQHGGEFRRI